MKNNKQYFKDYYKKNKDKIMLKRAEVKFICKSCQKVYGEKRRNQKFCSRRCLGLFYRGNPSAKSYVKLVLPRHHEANRLCQIREHRYVMEKVIGRKLKKNELVHHINGNKRDNRPENLQVVSKKEHGLIHMKERWHDFHSTEARKKQWKTRKKEKQLLKLIQENKKV